MFIRNWVLDLNTGHQYPSFDKDDDCVGHEYWTRSGDIVFDNRRKAMTEQSVPTKPKSMREKSK